MGMECEPEAEEPAAPKEYPPAKWKKVKDAEGKPKRRCLWEQEDGSICGKETADKKDKIEQHWLTHTGEKPYVCSRLKENGDVCGKEFRQSGHLSTHVSAVHDKERNHVCSRLNENDEVCGKGFTQPVNLTRHVSAVHDKEQNYVCDRLLEDGTKCGKACGTDQNLTRHVSTVHDKEQNYVCDRLLEDGTKCGKACGQASGLSTHQRTVHEKQRPYVCKRLLEDGTECGKAFGHASTLYQHQRTVHDKQRLHICDRLLEDGTECGKAFGQAGTLRGHEQAVHDEELRTPCPGATGLTECPYRLSKNPYYDKLCVRCFVASFPNDPRANRAKRHLHAKELAVREFLENAFPGYRWIFDRNCSGVVREIVRPDARAVLGRERLLIVEVDEHSHDTYDCRKERMREKTIANHAPRGAVVHLIRFNPDAYLDKASGRRIPSCFQISKVEGIVTVHPDRVDDWKARLETLRLTIQEIIDHRHQDIVVPECVLDDDRFGSVVPVELFYDAVREKFPDGNVQRLAALKRNAVIRKQAGGSSSSDPLPSEDESSSSE